VSRRWSRRTGYVALGVAAACALTLFILVLTSALDTGKGILAAAFLMIVGALATISTLVAEDGAPVGAPRHSAWLKPRPIGFLFVAIFIGFGTMTNALALFEPRPAVESEPHAIENNVNTILTRVTPRPEPPPRILSRIVGVWGEPGCAVTYRFRIAGGALIIDSIRQPPHTDSYHLVATIAPVSADVINVVGEEPSTARGSAATFTYFTNGVTQRLRWDDRVRPVPLDLDRCA
jgi:hypothetical protein